MTARLNRGTTATCASAVRASDAEPPASCPCHRAISSSASPIAASSLVSRAAALAGPTVWMPRPLTMRRPASRVRRNSASWAAGKAEPKTRADVVPAAIRRRTNSAATSVREHRIGEARLGGEDAALEPLEQLAATELVGRETSAESARGCRRSPAAGSRRSSTTPSPASEAGQVGPRAGVRIRPSASDREGAVGLRDERVRGVLERRRCPSRGAGDPGRSSRRLLLAMRVSAPASAAARVESSRPVVAAA